MTEVIVRVILEAMERIKGLYQWLRTRFLAWVRPQGAVCRVGGQETRRRVLPDDALRSSQETSAPATEGQSPSPPLKRPAEGWEFWWPAGLAGLGIALTVLARWSRKRSGKGKEKQNHST